MSNDEKRDPREEDKIEREKSRVRWELSDIKDELMYDLDDAYDDLKDEIDDLRDEAEDIKEELRDDLEELIEEREELLGEVVDMRGEIELFDVGARDKIEEARRKFERLELKIERHENKFKEKVQKKVDKAKKKAARINISVDPDMSDEWKDWAEDLGASVSELVRKSMEFVKENIGDIAKLEKLGVKLEKMGEGLEKAVKESGIEKLGEKFEEKINKHKEKSKINIMAQPDSNKDRIKKRVAGLIKLQKALPINKLAQALNKSEDYAENMIYELAAEGIEGELEGGVFNFTSPFEEVISKINELIDKM